MFVTWHSNKAHCGRGRLSSNVRCMPKATSVPLQQVHLYVFHTQLLPPNHMRPIYTCEVEKGTNRSSLYSRHIVSQWLISFLFSIKAHLTLFLQPSLPPPIPYPPSLTHQSLSLHPFRIMHFPFIFILFLLLLSHGAAYSLPGIAALSRSSRCPVILKPDPPSSDSADIRLSFFNRQQHTQPRIINGDYAASTLRSYLVSLLIPIGDELRLCTGTLISRRHVITAAHCNVDRNTRVYIAVPRRPGFAQDFTAIRVSVQHEEYVQSPSGTPPESPFDIAVVFLAEDAPQGAKFMKVNINRTLPVEGSVVRAIGYGVTDSEGFESPEEADWLRQVDVPVSSDATCEAKYTDVDSRLQVCAGYRGGGCDTW